MAKIRIYTDIKDIGADLTVILEHAPSHHLQKVLRVKSGDTIKLFNGDGFDYLAEIEAFEKNSVVVRVKSVVSNDKESVINIHLGQGVSKGDRMDFVIQKAVELGVTEITPLITERCNVRLDKQRAEKRLQHWQKVAISAAEQSGRSVVPTIHPQMKSTEWLGLHEGFNILCDPKSEKKLSELPRPGKSKINVLIGPEGGLTDDEINFAHSQGFQGVKMGPRILRTETAALSILTLLQGYYGDL